jgi:hypothetical protein
MLRASLRVVAVAAAAAAVAAPTTASAEPHDARPSNWHEAGRTTPLLNAPPPENPVAVCVVDTGVTLTPDLEVPVIARTSDDGGTPEDVADGGHGTHVATFIAGQINGWGMAGTWPAAKVVSVRVFPPDGGPAQAYAYARALDQCRQHPDVKVVNLSIANPQGSDEERRELENRIAVLRYHRDINVVVAAGNGGGGVESPGAARGALTVAAAALDGSLCRFTAFGPEVDLMASGCSLDAADARGTPTEMSGTSFAAPQVAATLAAIRSYAGLNAEDSEAAILSTARPYFNGRHLDAAAALQQSGIQLDPSPSTEPSSLDHPPPHGRDSAAIPLLAEAYAAPRGAARYVRSRKRLQIRVRNRPSEALVQARIGRRIIDRDADTFWIRSRALIRRARVRYMSDVGESPWVRLRVSVARG